ncbi:MAG: hypothetical protein AAF628_19290 [Planctomycetota bacterium]
MTDDRRAQLLEEVVTGARLPDDPEVRALMVRDPEWAAELAELVAMQRVLDATGESEAATLRQAAATPLPSPPRPTSRRWLWLAAAAAAAALALAFLLRRGAEDDPGATVLGPAVELLEPRGDVTAYGTFRWRGSLPPGGWFEVRVFAEPAGRPPVARSQTRLREASWQPDAAEQAGLPQRIRWQVTTFDAGGAAVERASAEAQLR